MNKHIKYFLFSVLIISAFCTCEKEFKSGQGLGGHLATLISIKFDWKPDEVRVFSGSKGIDLDIKIFAQELKSANLVVFDTISKRILVEKNLLPLSNVYHQVIDTFYIQNVSDTIFAKMIIEASDPNEVDIVERRLKITK